MSVSAVFEPRAYALPDGRAVTVRAAVPDDAQAMLDYMHATLPEVQAYILTTPEEFDYTLEQERDLIADRDADLGGLWLLAVLDGRVVGSLQCVPGTRKRLAHTAGIGMTLHADVRGQGLGGAMLNALVAWAECHRVLELLQLAVYADNARAIGLYRGAGFVESGRIPNRTKFGLGDYKHELNMWRDVRNAEQQ